MFPQNVMYYGKPDDQPTMRTLRAGPLTVLYENGDLRYIRLGEHEVIRRLYSAVRDHNWGTVLPVFSNVQINEQADSFHIQYDVENRQDDIHFVWHGEISGEADGTIRFAMRGEALTTFRRNRVGFCILHPSECAGTKARVEHVDGSVEEATFPTHIFPQYIVDGIIKPVFPFNEMRALSHEVMPGVWAELRLEGDIFEMEDQRNWLDASYKTYCTPLRLPFPVEVPRGTVIEQSLTLRISAAQSAAPLMSDDKVYITMPEQVRRLPLLGIESASHDEPLSTSQLERLKALHLAHLRVTIDMAMANNAPRLQRADAEATTLDVPLEIAVRLSRENVEANLQAFVTLLSALKANVARLIVLRAGELTTAADTVRLLRQHISNVSIVSGTDANFCELNRERAALPQLAEQVDALTFSANPQVHAFDNASLVETLTTIPAAVETARSVGSGKPAIVSPITFKMRLNPYATAAATATAIDRLPSQVDVRQMSLFGAAWTLGCISALVSSGVESATLYETTGWLGVMDTEAGAPAVTPQFYSAPGMTFPLYHVLADVGEFAGADAQPLHVSDPLRATGIALVKDGRLRILIANLTARAQMIPLPMPLAMARLRLLDETTFEQAAHHPAQYREQSDALPENTTSLPLRPYAVACIDQ
ncbi:MAG: hypothetical protein SF123_18975 [Chloroflexota bacterium]|nr:hypothetical protein [Chloroflexota bacterium]